MLIAITFEDNTHFFVSIHLSVPEMSVQGSSKTNSNQGDQNVCSGKSQAR